MTCASCGKELPGEFPFCPFCGAALADEDAAPGREERKVVTAVFADLVGFTARAEALDPEDVRALLAPYHAHLRSELERFGGTVEKFIGDAVMALFGAPVAHEDDPERAVRAALEIRDWAIQEGAELQVRIAVNTGEALVNLGARPSHGEAMAAGDVVNTAARLQAAAPLNGILVGEQTYRATADAVEYRPAEPVAAKGKSAALPVWEALQARSRLGVDVGQRVVTPLVGRSRELDLLSSTLARVREERSPQLVTLVGVPGIGKSRLVYELFRLVDEDPELITWRQGRCLPYGDGVTFWALAEAVKAQAGILESDSRQQAEEKLARTVEQTTPDPAEAQWLVRHLRPLAGLTEEGAATPEEAFAAWRRFLEGLAERPLVLVFEDLHWADDSLLDFVDQLAERVTSVPLLVLGTARPELLQRRSGWGGGKSNALTISLSPLSEADTARLLDALVERPLLEPGTQDALVARAGGNPLFAEQYARILLERGAVAEVPETVQGIIAARLDALPAEEKRLLQDAAVVGKVFWLGAVEAVDGLTRWQAEELLHALERKEFVQRARVSTVASESEYAFRHLLIRDIAYSQIPRAARSRKHERAAAWIESLGRPDDQAELLAHHYLQALELAEAAGLDSSSLAESARRALRDAGDRAAALYAADTAQRFYEAALRLCPDGEPERAELLFRRAVPVGHHVGGGDPEQLAEARDALLAIGDRARAAEAEMLIAQRYWIEGRRDVSERHGGRAEALVEGEPPSRSRAWVLMRSSTRASLLGDHERAIEIASEARAVSEQLGWDEGLSESLGMLGLERVYGGDASGLDDISRGVDLAATGSVGGLARVLNSLAVAHQVLGNLGLAYQARLDSLRAAERTGSDALIRWFRPILSDHRYRLGEWDAALEGANGVIEAESRTVVEWQAHATRAAIRLARSDVSGALRDTESALAVARASAEIQALHFAWASAAHVFSVAGERERAIAVADELIGSLQRGVNMQFAVTNLPVLASAALRLDLADELADALHRHPTTPWTRAAHASIAGDVVGAAEILHATGSLVDEMEARLRAAKQLIAGGDLEAGHAQLHRALAFYRSVGATRYVEEAEALLAAAT